MLPQRDMTGSMQCMFEQMKQDIKELRQELHEVRQAQKYLRSMR